MKKNIILKKGKTIKVQVKVKSKDNTKVPDWGLGTGILAEQEFVTSEDVTEENQVRFWLKRDEIYEQLLKETVEPVFAIIEKKKK